MKFLCIFFWLTIVSITGLAQKTIEAKVDSVFTLAYISVGFGSNMHEMQPAFRVKGYKFIYTSEQAWEFKNTKIAKPDTLYMGDLRTSSIDSILNITREIKGESVYKLNPRVMSGRVIYLDISSLKRKLKFELHNSFDPTAQKIIDILNSYIPDKDRKLGISNITPKITEIK